MAATGYAQKSRPLRPIRTLAQKAFAILFCLSLAVWSVAPAKNHAPEVLETIHDHLEMIADHGHSHGFEEDLFRAMHGHAHDKADHDRSQAMLTFGTRSAQISGFRDAWPLRESPEGGTRVLRIDRPPHT